jgi:nondiscriminating aspartyl-tRNA synthetase
MERIWSSELAAHLGERVTIAGWLHRFRHQRQVSFLILRDARGLAQIVIEDRALAERIAALNHESVLTVSGNVIAEPQAPGGIELHDPVIEVISAAIESPPFDLFRPELQAQLPTRLDHAAISLRHLRAQALFALQHALMSGFRSALTARGFTEIHTPKIVAAATESGANVFPIEYFGRTAYLAQSPQLYKQIMVGVFERVFEVGPVFRAEPHDTARHLNEYTSLDVELGFITDHRDVMSLLEQVIHGMLDAVEPGLRERLAGFGIELPLLPSQFPSIHFTDALELVSRELGEDVTAEPDLAPAHERILGEWAKRWFNSDALFVEGYPAAKRPFYTHPDLERPGYTNGFDLLFRGLELVTGGQRLHCYDHYLAAMHARNLPLEGLEWYLEAFKHGMPPHGGFAIGLERFVARIAGLENVRLATLFPRDLNRLTP